MRKEPYTGVSILLLFNLILLSSFINQGSGLGQVEAVFKTVSVSNINVTDGYACRDDNCKIKMKVTFTKPVSSPKIYKTEYISFKSSVILDQTGHGALNDGVGTEFNNPINVTAPAQDSLKQFSVNIQLSDYSQYRKVVIATLTLTEDVTTGYIYNKTLSHDSVTLTLSYKVICEENYYFDCSKYCIGRNDSLLGHFTCNPVTGGEDCLEGWAGDHCRTRICSSDLTMEGGRVTSTPREFYKENDTITVECDPDFQLNPHLQSNELICQKDGQWSFNDFSKICTRSGCGGCSRLKQPKHGKLTYSSLNYCQNAKVNSTVSVRCYPHYIPLVRYPGLKCGEDKLWVNSSGHSVQETGRHFIDCIATGDSDGDIDVSEDTLKKRLANSAAAIGTISLLSFLAIILIYCVLYHRRVKERKVSPRRQSYVPEDELGRRITLKSAAIGDVVLQSSVPTVNTDAYTDTKPVGLTSAAGYINKGFSDHEFDYEF